ncbi:gp41 [Hyphantria cunea granulovirus]|uniref:Gp41 n=1 Tax=Hyphantria cunea granulovirus TaxID=307448 RepID=A0AAF1D299_9BBAC|nr:gp41 [Hyphantria cunea granulovirus]QBQ01645.1 gp41 [Hyphantria cunea granulovirus]
MENITWNSLTNMINMYRGNNTAQLAPEEIGTLNFVRDIFIKSDPVSVTATKRFENDQQLIDYYRNLEKKYSNRDESNVTNESIFNKSFIISNIMKSYADKFYKRRLNLGAAHLSDVVRYQMANAITQNKPLPIITNDATDDYIKLLYHKAPMPNNLNVLFESKINENVNLIRAVFDNLVADLLTGAYNGYYLKHCLSPETQRSAYRFRDNITFLVNAPLTLSTNIYDLIENVVANKNPEHDYTPFLQHQYPVYSLENALSNMALENEAMRRAVIQQLHIKYNALPGGGGDVQS